MCTKCFVLILSLLSRTCYFWPVFSCSFDFRITFLSSLPWHIKQILSTAVCSQRTTSFDIYYFAYMRGKIVPLTQESANRNAMQSFKLKKFILVAVKEMRAGVGRKKMTNLPLEKFRKENMFFLRWLWGDMQKTRYFSPCCNFCCEFK